MKGFSELSFGEFVILIFIIVTVAILLLLTGCVT